MKKEDKVKELFEICGGTAKDVAKVLGMPLTTAQSMCRKPPRLPSEYRIDLLIENALKRTASIKIICDNCLVILSGINRDGSSTCNHCGCSVFRINASRVK